MRSLFVGVLLLFAAPVLAVSNLEFAKKYQKQKDYGTSLVYELKALTAEPNSGYLAARVGQNYYVYHRQILKGIHYYEQAESNGFERRWFYNQFMGACIWAGFYYMGEQDWENAVRYFKKAEKINQSQGFNKKHLETFYQLARQRQNLGVISPEYHHRVTALMINHTDAAPPNSATKVQGTLSDSHKRLTLLSLKGVKSFWEAMSRGHLSMKIRVIKWDGPLKSIYKHPKNKHTPKKSAWIIDTEAMSLNMRQITEDTISDTDTYLIVWSAGKRNLANAGAKYYLTQNGQKKHRRGYAQIPGERIWQHGYFVTFHELFHVLERTARIKPDHGYRDANRKRFPDWKGNNEYDYYHWHFQKTLAKLPGGWKDVTFLK